MPQIPSDVSVAFNGIKRLAFFGLDYFRTRGGEHYELNGG